MELRGAVRTDIGEDIVLAQNKFLTELLPGTFLNPPAGEDLAVYQAPFPTPPRSCNGRARTSPISKWRRRAPASTMCRRTPRRRSREPSSPGSAG